MRLAIDDDRDLGEIPWGALLAAPLFFLPLGAWFVEHGYIDFGVCGLKQMLSVPCLSCGATRATVALLHGHPVQAIMLQPLIVVLYVLLLVWGGFSLWAFLRRKSVWLHLTDREDVAAKILILVAPLANWAYLIEAGI